MSTTSHKLIIGASQCMGDLADESVDLVVTSPPYPMIEMWDDIFALQDPAIRDSLNDNPYRAFELMHRQLDAVWSECYRLIRPGGFLCINIGDATRTIGGNFSLYENHVRIASKCSALGFTSLPCILWRKQTNAPNKFMGSGMLPCGAYVTLEHEWILIYRKGDKRSFASANEKELRMLSSYFWEERNVWFSDVWDVKGVKQGMRAEHSRSRSAAFPFEVPYRLINMFSQKSDVVLDPFVGTGTTMVAALVAGRNSVGVEIDPHLEDFVMHSVAGLDINEANAVLKHRVERHADFVVHRESVLGKEVKYYNDKLRQKVMTRQEVGIELNYITTVKPGDDERTVIAEYEELSNPQMPPFSSGSGLFDSQGYLK